MPEQPLEEIKPKRLDQVLAAAAAEVEIPPSQPRGGDDPPSPEAEAKDDKEDSEEEVPEDQEPPIPPVSCNCRKLKERLRRVFTARADGSFKVPDDLVKEYQNLHTRNRIERLFEKMGCDPERDRPNSGGFEFEFVE